MSKESDFLEYARLHSLYESERTSGDGGGGGEKGKKGREHSDLILIAKAVGGKKLTIEEFQILGMQVQSINDQFKAGSMTNAEYQARLWKIPEQFRLNRSNLVHFQPDRNKDGTPRVADDQPFDLVTKARLRWASEKANSPMSHELHKLGAEHSIKRILSDPAGAIDNRSADPIQRIPFGGMTHDELRAIPVGQRTEQQARAWTEAMLAHHEKQTKEMYAQDNARRSGQSASIPTAPKVQDAIKGLLASSDSQPKNSDSSLTSNAIKGMVSGPVHLDQETTDSPTAPQKRSLNWVDKAQMILDGVGVVDPTPFVDLGNAGISVARAFTDPSRSGEHIANAAISGISAIPYVGDFAKIFKYGAKAEKAVAGGIKAERAIGSEAKARGRGGSGIIQSALSGGISGAISSFMGGGGGSGGDGNSPPGSSPLGGAEPPGLDASGQAFESVMGRVNTAIVGVITNFRLFVAWLKRVDEASRKTIEDNRGLAQYNGQLALSYMKLDADRVRRDIMNAQGMSGPLSQLNSAQSWSEQKQQEYYLPYKQMNTRMQAIGSTIVGYMATLGEYTDLQRKLYQLIESYIGTSKVDESARNATEFSIRETMKNTTPWKVGVDRFERK